MNTRSDIRFWVYTSVRILQVAVLTLMVIYKLKTRLNAHIIMVYLAVSDIVFATEIVFEVWENRNILCLVSGGFNILDVCSVILYFLWISKLTLSKIDT